MKLNQYKGCNCRHCRSAKKRWRGTTIEKRRSHRLLRHRTRQALRQEQEPPITISTGYTA